MRTDGGFHFMSTTYPSLREKLRQRRKTQFPDTEYETNSKGQFTEASFLVALDDAKERLQFLPKPELDALRRTTQASQGEVSKREQKLREREAQAAAQAEVRLS